MDLIVLFLVSNRSGEFNSRLLSSQDPGLTRLRFSYITKAPSLPNQCLVVSFFIILLQEYDMLMVDYINDVRIIGVCTALFLLGIAMMSLEWVIRVRCHTLYCYTIIREFSFTFTCRA